MTAAKQLQTKRIHPIASKPSPEQGKVVLCFSLKSKEPDEVEQQISTGQKTKPPSPTHIPNALRRNRLRVQVKCACVYTSADPRSSTSSASHSSAPSPRRRRLVPSLLFQLRTKRVHPAAAKAFPYEGKVVLCFSLKSKEPDEVEQRISTGQKTKPPSPTHIPNALRRNRLRVQVKCACVYTSADPRSSTSSASHSSAPSPRRRRLVPSLLFQLRTKRVHPAVAKAFPS